MPDPSDTAAPRRGPARPRRRERAFLAPLALAAAAALSALCLAGCFGIAGEPQVAAWVNGDKVYEDEVTDYIEGFRSKNQEYETDSGWAEFLISNSYTAETIRVHVLDECFIPKLLIRQECARRGIALTDEELDGVIQREKDYYEGRYGANSWNSVLASYGYDEKSWRENESDRLLEEQLEDKVAKSAAPTSSEVQDQANETASNYNGKHSWYALFSDEEQASQARARLAPKDNGSTTLKRFRKRVHGARNAGWSSLPDARESLSARYLSALNEIGEGKVSQPVQVGDSWALVFCDRVFRVSGDDDYVPLRDVPKEIRAQLVSDARKAKQDKKFGEWLDELTGKAKITVEPMPDGLPYAVNVALDNGRG